jgi:Methane oxygenase PmoA
LAFRDPVPAYRHDAASGVVQGEVIRIRPDRTTVAIRERRRLRHVDLADDAYAVDWDVTLRAPQDVVLDRSPYNGQWGGYSGLAFRGRGDWRDTPLLLDDGESRDRVAPRRSRWCDLSGPVAVVPAGGVCVLDHPDNPSQPVPFYATCRAELGYGEGWANTVYPGVPVGRPPPPGVRRRAAIPLPHGRPRRRVGRRAVCRGVGGVRRGALT